MKIMRAFFVGILLCTECLPGTARAAQELAALPLEQSLDRARAGGKYRMLLHQFKVEADGKTRGAFLDQGYRAETTYAGNADLPKGFQVYVYPFWYIWRDRVTETEPEARPRSWGPEQATGKPDTPQAGDLPTTWASATQDNSDEWLLLEYKTPVWGRSVRVYETFNPGALVRITAFALDGSEVEVWSRPRVVVRNEEARIARLPFKTRVLTNRIKIYLDSPAVPGWNEIDAVGLLGASGGAQWATSAHASSTYGVAGNADTVADADPRAERTRRL